MAKTEGYESVMHRDGHDDHTIDSPNVFESWVADWDDVNCPKCLSSRAQEIRTTVPVTFVLNCEPGNEEATIDAALDRLTSIDFADGSSVEYAVIGD